MSDPVLPDNAMAPATYLATTSHRRQLFVAVNAEHSPCLTIVDRGVESFYFHNSVAMDEVIVALTKMRDDARVAEAAALRDKDEET